MYVLQPNSPWIKGPHFLYKNKSVSFESKVPSTGRESTKFISHLIVYCKPPYLSFIKWENYSSFFNLIKNIVCILKLKHSWMNKKGKIVRNSRF